MSIKSVILSNHLILCHPLLLLPSIFPSVRWLKTTEVDAHSFRGQSLRSKYQQCDACSEGPLRESFLAPGATSGSRHPLAYGRITRLSVCICVFHLL